MKSFIQMLLLFAAPEAQSSVVPIAIVGTILAAIFAVIGFYGKRYYNNRDTAEINAYAQLEKIFVIISTQLEKKDLSDKEKEKEIQRLEGLNDELAEKLKTGRLDLLDLRFAMRNVKRFLDDNNICDEAILQLVGELDTKLKEISDALKVEPLVKK